MDQSFRKTKYSNSTVPFKATQLWNEAVSLLQKGMPTGKHFAGMRYYDNCFSGKEAIEWLTKTLMENPRFGNNVTKDGIYKLLQHFLKSGVFQSVKGSLLFKERGLYEFVHQTISSPSQKDKKKQSLSSRSLKLIDHNIQHEKLTQPLKKHNQPSCVSPQFLPPKSGICWKDFILERIQTFLPSLSVELLIDPTTIQADWIMYNVCPEFENVRKKTEFPFWVFTAITSVIQCHEREYTTYCGFEKDVYTVVRDYLRSRSVPMIPYFLYELIMYTFNHIHYMDLERKNRLRDNNSVENLMLSLSTDWSECDLTKTVLPPNSCFETAFTSDEPVTRIVPQSSVDSVCLSNHMPKTIISNNKFENCDQYRIDSCNQITNKGNKKQAIYVRRTQSMAHINSNVSLPLCNSAMTVGYSSLHKNQSYINYGLSQSMDNLLAVNDNESLNFEEAMQSVNCLMQASCDVNSSQANTSSSKDSISFSNSYPFYKADLMCIDSCLWYEDIQEIARNVFQSILMLMAPVIRTSLRMLIEFIDQLSIPQNCPIEKTEMIYALSAHILSPGPNSKNVYSQHLVLSVVYFLVDNCKHLFGDIQNDISENNNQLKQRVFCEQLTKNQFEHQSVTSSWQALGELLEQIINDNKMKTKDKRKRLKKFKEAHPHVYNQRFGESTNITSLVRYR